MTHLIQIDRLQKRFGGLVAVRDLSFGLAAACSRR